MLGDYNHGGLLRESGDFYVMIARVLTDKLIGTKNTFYSIFHAKSA